MAAEGGLVIDDRRVQGRERGGEFPRMARMDPVVAGVGGDVGFGVGGPGLEVLIGRIAGDEGVVLGDFRIAILPDPRGAGRQAVIEHMRSRGFHRTERPVTAPVTARPGRPNVTPERAPLVGKLDALLEAAGRPWAYAAAMAKRMHGVDDLAWCTAEQLHAIVAALEYDRRRRARK